MPYRKKNGKKTFKSSKSANAKATQALKLVKKVIRQEEKKNVDVAYGPTAQSTTEAVTHLTPIAQGTTHNQRVGLKVTANYLQMRFTCRGNATAIQQSMRIVIVADMQNEGAAPAWTDIFQSASYLSPRQLISQPANRWKVLMDKTVSMDTNGATGVVNFNKFIKLKHIIKYSGTNSTDESDGNIWILSISDQATNTPTLQYYSRFRFTDD